MRCSAQTIPRAISTSPTLKTLLSGQEAGMKKMSPRNASRGSAKAVELWNPGALTPIFAAGLPADAVVDAGG
jgi:hypothetical protein